MPGDGPVQDLPPQVWVGGVLQVEGQAAVLCLVLGIDALVLLEHGRFNLHSQPPTGG